MQPVRSRAIIKYQKMKREVYMKITILRILYDSNKEAERKMKNFTSVPHLFFIRWWWRWWWCLRVDVMTYWIWFLLLEIILIEKKRVVKELLNNTKIVGKDSSMPDMMEFNIVELRSKIIYRLDIPYLSRYHGQFGRKISS